MSTAKCPVTDARFAVSHNGGAGGAAAALPTNFIACKPPGAAGGAGAGAATVPWSTSGAAAGAVPNNRVLCRYGNS